MKTAYFFAFFCIFSLSSKNETPQLLIVNNSGTPLPLIFISRDESVITEVTVPSNQSIRLPNEVGEYPSITVDPSNHPNGTLRLMASTPDCGYIYQDIILYKERIESEYYKGYFLWEFK